MKTRDDMFHGGVALLKRFCALNYIPEPAVERLNPQQREYHLGTCAYYRPTTIRIMVEKCANRGFGGRAWSWPSYAIDRTPFGVLQHELGHHIDEIKTGHGVTRENVLEKLFSKRIYDKSKELPLTGYLGTDKETVTFYMEWFAENFRLYVTNPDLSKALRPLFFNAMVECGIACLNSDVWESTLLYYDAPSRIVEQARKKVQSAK